MKCPRCQVENDEHLKFCEDCGTQLVRVCPNCRAQIGHGKKFCGECGSAVDAPSPSRFASPEAYTPKHLADKIFSSRPAIEGERKQVTVLFCDIAGSTALAHRLGAETMHRLLNGFFDAALAEVHRYEGTLNQFLGDGFMALFGAPIAHEDHARRAAHAALSVRQRCHATIADAATGRAPLTLGLNTGPVVVGKIGDNLRMDYTAIGDTTNLAARMQQLAAPGEILLPPHTWEAIHHHFNCEALGERRVKGKSLRVSVYRLHGAHASRRADESAASSVRGGPMVGRETEVATLRGCLTQLGAGRGGIVGVIGDAGVGKSRLLLEVRHLQGSSVTWGEGYALSFGQNLSYSPFMDMLRRLANIDERKGPHASWLQLESFLRGRLSGQVAQLLPFAGMLMGLELPAMSTGLVSRLDPQEVRGQIFIVARRIFEALARERPLVLELEDWQWADESSAALVEHLLPLTETEALLVCFVGRPDDRTACTRMREVAAQRYPQRYIEMLLGPLSSSDSNHVIDNLIGLERLPLALRGAILRKAEGNPLFIEEVIGSLQANGTLQRDSASGALRVLGHVEDIELPDSVEAIIMARIDRLESDVKQVLRLAAVIGRSFYRRILQALDEADQELDRCLDQLQHFELIRQRRLAPEVEYMFKHALVHEASYRSILEDRRRDLHKRVADAIETLFVERLDEFSGFLAYHYAQAQDWGKAQRYLLRAGDRASQMAADVEAMRHYRGAIQAYGRAFGDRWDPLERASLERKIGEALFRLGQHDQASEHLHNALDLLGVRHPRTPLRARLHILGQIVQQVWHRALATHYGQRLDPSQVDSERIRAYVALGWLDYWDDEEKFFLDVIAGLNWAERRGVRAAVAQGLFGLGVACDVLGARRLAGFYHNRALKVAAELGDSISTASAEVGSALHQAYVGDWERAVAGFQRATNIFKDQGKLRERGIADATLTWLLQARGQLAQAQVIITELGQVADDAGDAQSQVFSKILGAVATMYQGRLAESAAGLDKAIESAQAVPDYQSLCHAYGNRASCALYMGDHARAAAAVDEGLSLLRKTRIAPFNTHALRWSQGWLALTLIERGKSKDKKEAMERVRAATRALRRLAVAFAGAVPIQQCLNGSIHWLGGRQVQARDSWDRAIASAEQLGSRLHLALILQEMGRLMQASSHLEKALRIFEEIGSPLQVARTLRYLGQIAAQGANDNAIHFFECALKLHEQMSAEYELGLVQLAYRELQTRIK
jgi:class 3 adenylate cyclase/tetratricopeptide (TPR) repeat protein